MAQFSNEQTLALALQHHHAGRWQEAERHYAQILARQPNHFDAIHNLGVLARQAGRPDLAVDLLRRAVALKPNSQQAHYNLGDALKDIGRLEEAVASYRQAIALHPDFPEAHNNLGIVLHDLRRHDESIDACRRAISLRPNFAEAYLNLGNPLKERGQPDDAIAAYRQAVALKPDCSTAYNNLGNALKDVGELDEAVAAFRRAIALDPKLMQAHSNLILTLHYHPAFDARAIADELGRWNRAHAEPLLKEIQAHKNDRDLNRPLRIGYFSPDFRDHVVGRNLLPLFRNHDRRQFEITCYAQVLLPDASTAQFQGLADRWRNVVGVSDEQLAKQIRDDQIDILVDLALHTAGRRLLVFARKPAPVQATFAGYPGSTGLSAIDYRLSDPYLDPIGTDESIYSERTICLPDSFWCYDPLETADIPANSLPAWENGFITFGCLNNFTKINENVLSLWALVLKQVKNSRLLLMAPAGNHRQRTIDQLSREGIAVDRIEFAPRASRRKYLGLYHRIDLGLDTFPYNGHTTSLDSFWMGVPVVTLIGQTAVGRAGWCQLSNLQLTELAAQTPEQFIEIAASLARDLPRLQTLRSTLRQRLEQSPLMDAPRFARNIETAYRQMWRTWCATESVET
jgi:protein O-GlcNAc transferase